MGIYIRPKLVFGGVFGGSFWAQGAALGSLLCILFGSWGRRLLAAAKGASQLVGLALGVPRQGCQQQLKDANQLAGL